MVELIYPELSYKIIGILFSVFNELGYGYQEKYYQRAVAKFLISEKIKFNKELSCPLVVRGESIGRYQLDFLINDQIVLELKVADDFYPRHIKQVLGYIKHNKIKLGILAIFTKNELKYKRIPNTYD